MSYYKFIFKKNFKNIPNIIPIVLFFIIVFVFFIFNNRTAHSLDFVANSEMNISIKEEVLKEVEEEKQSGSSNPEINMTISELKKNINLDKESIELYKEKKFKQAIQIKLDKVINDIEHVGNNPNDFELKESMIKQNLIYQKLVKLNVAEEVEGFENKGFTFSYWVMGTLIPVLFTLILCIFLTPIFTEQYYEDIDKEMLLPSNKSNIFLQKILFSFGTVLLIYLGVIFISFIIASLFNGIGDVQYPIIQYGKSNFDMSTLSVGEILSKALILQILSLLSIVTTVNLVSQLVITNLNTLFLSSLILIGQNLISDLIAPLYKIVHLIPGTYFSSTSVITNYISKKTDNYEVNFHNGIIILSSYILISLIVSYSIIKFKEKKITLNKII